MLLTGWRRLWFQPQLIYLRIGHFLLRSCAMQVTMLWGQCSVRGKNISFMLYTMQVELLQRPNWITPQLRKKRLRWILLLINSGLTYLVQRLLYTLTIQTLNTFLPRKMPSLDLFDGCYCCKNLIWRLEIKKDQKM